MKDFKKTLKIFIFIGISLVSDHTIIIYTAMVKASLYYQDIKIAVKLNIHSNVKENILCLFNVYGIYWNIPEYRWHRGHLSKVHSMLVQ